MKQKIQAILDESQCAIILGQDKKGNGFSAINGSLPNLLIGFGDGLITLSKKSNIPLEAIGDMLNKAVETIQEVDKENDV